jgi:transcription factor IIIB subunit 2
MAVSKGRGELQGMIDTFRLRPREECLEAAHRLYRLALQQGFTKGRRVNQARGG